MAVDIEAINARVREQSRFVAKLKAESSSRTSRTSSFPKKRNQAAQRANAKTPRQPAGRFCIDRSMPSQCGALAKLTAGQPVTLSRPAAGGPSRRV